MRTPPLRGADIADPAMISDRTSLLLWAVFLVVVGAACSSAPDKRVLQYLNTQGFGNRYTGNSEEENWVAIKDTLVVSDSYHADELNVNLTVDIDGTVLMPELGAVQVAGLTRTEIQALLMEKYSPYYDLLDIKVQIITHGKKYFIFGEVGTQGEQDFSGDLTIFEAVTKASPSKDTANLGRVRLIRADPKDPFVQTINIADLLDSGDSTFNVHVQERDIIYVPPTWLAQVGYFLDTLLFPVKQVLTGLSGAFYSLGQFHYYTSVGNGIF
jgi:protein involved in polysaccharide export with SLBB domain